MIGLTSQQSALLAVLRAYIGEHGTAPTFAQMRDALGLRSNGHVSRLLFALEERGAIRRLRNRARAIELLAMPDIAIVTMAREFAETLWEGSWEEMGPDLRRLHVTAMRTALAKGGVHVQS